jgi:hypothetical protein
VIHLAVRQQLGQPAFDAERVRAVVAEERLAVRADEQDPPLRRPAAHDHVRPEPGHPSRRPALRGHQVDLGVLLVAPDVGEPFAVRRDRRVAHFAEAGCQPARDAPERAHRPQIVIADEHDGIATQRGMPQITADRHG